MSTCPDKWYWVAGLTLWYYNKWMKTLKSDKNETVLGGNDELIGRNLKILNGPRVLTAILRQVAWKITLVQILIQLVKS